MLKNPPPANVGDAARSLGREDSLEEGTHSVSLSGESLGQRSLVGYSPQDHKELDTTEVTWHECKK